ncbi:uncharacterized protein BP5553_04375 [Venustampulla echinocandica]|uniref:Uncharacterized protein n=1 Tax=Venustampulla echinocandica TaxID=2656787 RepID=A0A370TN46_9HELO|nr:uncharacterized protein BP5553_04375 [Venustampulla echinocandica]RDL36942.1 hypothetical protein BP5553_04375 [Venustampulla echinocandica]
MDEFAQSREDDDLFADEFEPIPEPITIVHELPTPATDRTRPADTGIGENTRTAGGASDPAGTFKHTRRDHGQQDRRQRGRRGGTGPNGLQQSRYAHQDEPTPAAAPNIAPATSEVSATDQGTPSSEPQPSSSKPPTHPESRPGPPSIVSARMPAVRGDRSATGGPVHKKLTDEELTIKLEKMAILNAQKAERHRLSEADQAAFQHREKELAKERREKRVEEQKNSRQMEMERAKNRQRKIQAQGVREWDSEKVESDIVDGKGRGRTSEYVRGNHGGVIRGRGAGLAGSKYAAAEGDEASGGVPEEEYKSARGRGRHEIRGRGTGGRGGSRGGKLSGQPKMVPAPEDFPSLPTPPTSNTFAKTEEKGTSSTADQTPGEWADEMATPVEEKHMTI